MAESVYFRPQVEQWRQKLDEIAAEPRTTFTKAQVVEELFDTIEKALQTRSYSEVAEGLKEWGLDITEGSLKQYVSRFRKTHKTTKVAASRSTARSTAKSTAGKKRSGGDGKKQGAGKGSQRSLSQAGVNTGSTVIDSLKAKANERTPDGFLEMPDEL